MTVLLLLIGVLLTVLGLYLRRRPRIDHSFTWSILIVGVLLVVGSLVLWGLDVAA